MAGIYRIAGTPGASARRGARRRRGRVVVVAAGWRRSPGAEFSANPAHGPRAHYAKAAHRASACSGLPLRSVSLGRAEHVQGGSLSTDRGTAGGVARSADGRRHREASDEAGPRSVRVSYEGREPPPGATGSWEHGKSSLQTVGPSYFETLAVPVLLGRVLNERDTAAAPRVAVINQTMAKRYWPNQNPLDQQIASIMPGYLRRATIVGVVADFRLSGMNREPFPEIFWPMAQSPSSNAWIMVRTGPDLSAMVFGVRAAIREIDADLPLLDMQSMDGVIADSLWRPLRSASS
jgi:hypothetical protein